MMKDANAKLIAQIEENKTKGGFKIVDVSGIAPEALLSTIIEKNVGKVIFIDFWSTWCGPCRDAMVDAEPVKDALKGKDVVFVYLTDESSPLGTWNNMIVNIPGDHYRLNDVQKRYMSTTEYQYRGIPSYAIIGKDGTKKHFQTGFMGPDQMRKIIEKEL